MSQLLKLLTTIAPPPPQPAPREYSGLELFRWKMFVFRPYEFKFEAVMLSLVAAYLLFYLVGKTINMSRAKSTVNPFISLLQSQFTVVRPLVSSSSALHLLYATGRRNLVCLHATLKLYPIHDIVGLVIHFGRWILEPVLYDGSEGIVFTLTLGKGDKGLQGDAAGVWALVEKGAMRPLKYDRWDMSFPRLHEYAAVPETHALFAEHSDVSDVLLKTPNVGITELLANKKALSVLKYFLVTDQPSERPSKGPLKPERKERQVVVSVKKPSGTAEVEAVAAWVQVALNIADLLARPNIFKPEVYRKLAKTRKEVEIDLVESFKKDQAERAPAEETAEEKRAAKKRAERAAMSEKEAKKAEELEKKRAERKMAKKQMTK